MLILGNVCVWLALIYPILGQMNNGAGNFGATYSNFNPLGGSYSNFNPLGGSNSNFNPFGGSYSNINPLGGSYSNFNPLGGSNSNFNLFGGTYPKYSPFGLNFGSKSGSLAYPVQYKDDLKLSGRAVFATSDYGPTGPSYGPTGPSYGPSSTGQKAGPAYGAKTYSNGLAVTISQEGRGGYLFGESAKGQGLSMNLQIQSSRGGSYYIALTSLARARDGCNQDTLGSLLINPSTVFSFYGGYRNPELPDGVLDLVELSPNVQKTIVIDRIPGVDKIQDLAGRGVAICAADGREGGKEPCSGLIVACVGLAYSKDDVSLGPLQQPQYQTSQPYQPTNSGQAQDYNNQQGYNGNTQTSGSGNYGDEGVDTYDASSGPIKMDYEPNKIQRPAANNGPVIYGTRR
ncbi:uncharacterized protein LOC131943906 isoform X2 [Physella acuta]|uniref:uncharacterized protein LOC131943906 isoform X2 n=1 Tax=Physella acuta TaxID=109671 RepID=UPI0027DB00D2|nr:uncharacterized protein LOC131943906 isoform X2 [Physella acuta]